MPGIDFSLKPRPSLCPGCGAVIWNQRVATKHAILKKTGKRRCDK